MPKISKGNSQTNRTSKVSKTLRPKLTTNNTKKTTNISSILLGFVLLSGTIAIGYTPATIAEETVTVCDEDGNICKEVIITDENEDGVIVVNELVTYNVTVTATNNLGEAIANAEVKDNFGGDLEIGQPDQDEVTPTGGTVDCEVKLKGKTQKAQVRCDADVLEPDETAGFEADLITDINPGQARQDEPKREYTSCGIHEMNSGATLKGVLADGTEVEFSTPSVSVEVFEFADLSGDCDQDGLNDAEDPVPFVFNDADGDGVGDGFDLCPDEGTEVTGSVDSDGCPN